MARYTNFFMTASSPEAISQALVSALEACALNVIYQDPVCIVAKERPGQVSFTQLATIELLISPPTLESGGSRIDLVVKNEELPLRSQNHCREVFTQIDQAISAANEQNASQPASQQKDNGVQNVPNIHSSDNGENTQNVVVNGSAAAIQSPAI
jgi:hypothetical protein